VIRRAAAAALVLLAGCAGAGPIVVPLGAEHPAAGRVPAPPAAAMSAPCRIAVTLMRDERSNRGTVGVIAERPFEAADVRGWVARKLAALDVVSPRTGTLLTEVGIQRVYARAVATQIEGVVALRVAFTDVGGTTTERLYRGVVTRLNWASTQHELGLLLDDALAEALAKLAADAAQLCR
jgi:hypothetical protein